MPSTVVIDLDGIGTKRELLLCIGEVLEFGGPKGNHPILAGAVSLDGGWGVNWDALYDSLKELEKGGIWGTGKKLEFPLTLRLLNFELLLQNSKADFTTLEEILDDTEAWYREQRKIFRYEFVNARGIKLQRAGTFSRLKIMLTRILGLGC